MFSFDLKSGYHHFKLPLTVLLPLILFFCFLFNKPQRFAYSNASASGCGSVITLNEDCVCHKLWERFRVF